MILRGTPANIRAYITDANGAPVPKKEAPAVTVAITQDSDGAVVSTGAASFEEDGVVVSELPAQPDLDLLTVVWTVVGGTTVTTYEEIVGARLCTLAAVTEDVSGETISAATVRAARDIAEQFLEDECNVAFRPRYRRAALDGAGTQRITFPDAMVTRIRSASVVDGDEVDLEGLKLYGEGGYIWREELWPSGSQNVEVAYEHGFTSPSPSAGRCAALLARHIATKRPSNLDDRSTSMSTETASYTLIVPGIRGMATALPEINAFIQSWQFPEVG